MIRVRNIKIYPPKNLTVTDIAKKICVDESEILEYNIYKRSIDARKKTDIHYVYTVDVRLLDETSAKNIEKISEIGYEFPKIKKKKAYSPLIVGSGPAGLMCALMLAEAGLKPVLIERGEDVDSRTEKVNGFWKNGKLDTATNVQFGEGGAGTFSDGKLNTGIKNVRCRKVLEEFVRFGAPGSILYESKPHVGTDYLCKIVKGIRERIIECGGEVRFKNKLVDILEENNCVRGAVIESDNQRYVFKTEAVVLSIGHSAADTFSMLYNKNIQMVKKAFSVGVRIEHDQNLINFSQYGELSKYFENADYKLSCHLENGRGVYTFCMCPGGYVVNSSSEEGTIVTNGMSYNGRDGKNANSAVLVSVLPEDIKGENPLNGFEFQKKIEKKAFEIGGSNYSAPCQTVMDFLKGIPTEKPGNVIPTIKPNVKYCDISEVFPEFVTNSLKEALPIFNKKINGFVSEDAVLTAPETRSSSPVRIVRNNETLQSVSLKGLYPCGEGAGYAGGIMSAAVDGIKCAEAIADN